MLAYLLCEALILPFYLIVLPHLYGLPRLGSVTAICIFAVPFVLAVSALGFIMAAAFRNPLVVQLLLAAIGLPFFFLAGFAWPSEAMPQIVKAAAILVPSTAAIDGFVRLSQLGARLSDVSSQILTLAILACLYGGIATALSRPKASN
jgi:ABC-2 type transport system permease protein